MEVKPLLRALWRKDGLVISTMIFGFVSAKYMAFMAIVVVFPDEKSKMKAEKTLDQSLNLSIGHQKGKEVHL